MSAAADVLTELTGLPPWAPRGCDVRVIVEARRVGYLASAPDGFYNEAHGVTMWRAWTCDDTETAADRLALAGLWPWPVGDDASPRWWCERCDALARRRAGEDVPYPVTAQPSWQQCDGDGAMHPPTLAALVAVASLGVEALRRAEGLALQLVGRAPHIVWRVMSREALDRYDDRPMEPGSMTPAQVTVRLRRQRRDFGVEWPDECPFYYNAAIHRAWPALRDLAALGLHIVAHGGDRVTLAVEAI